MSVDDLQLIDRLCDRYESDRRRGAATKIEDLLEEVADSLRPATLIELLRIDLELARRDGRPISVEDYGRRFAAEYASIEQVLHQELASTVADNDDSSGAVGGASLPPVASCGRYRAIRLYAQGGLGRIWIAADQEMNREVALKEISAEQISRPDARARFLQEAEITARLEHPGIVPVYGQGVASDGRPYYAMRLIRGESLEDAIRRIHRSTGESLFASERSLELRKYLAAFTALCNVVEFAHSRGVIHRDIKPANVLLGSFGETLVVDWGLAKPLSDEVVRNESAEPDANGRKTNPNSERGSEHAIFGTPQYMSPEQITRQSDRVGILSDVYSLGATLYQLLTGEAAFPAGSSDRVLQAVTCGTFEAPRKRKPDVPQALNAICLKAMALKPEDRYPSAKSLAEEIERWMADAPVEASPDSVLEKWSRFARRHSAWVTSGTIALIIVAIVATAAAWSVNLARQRAKEGEEAAIAAQNHERRQRQAAQSAILVLAGLFESADPLGVINLGSRESLEMTDHDSTRQLLDRGRRLVVHELADQPLYQAKLLNALGLAYFSYGDLTIAESLLEQAWQIRDAQIKAGAIPRHHPDVLASLWSNAIVKHMRSEADEAERLFREVLGVQLQDPAAFPPLVISRTQLQLGLLLWDNWRGAEAEPLLRAAVETRDRYLPQNDPAVAWARMILIACLLEQDKKLPAMQEIAKLVSASDTGASSGAVQAFLRYQEVVELRTKRDYHATVEKFRPLLDEARQIFGRDHPVTMLAQFEYAGMLSQKGDLLLAEQVARQTLKQLPPILSHNPRVAEVHFRLGELLAQRGDKPEAEFQYRKAMEIGGTVHVRETPWGIRAAVDLAQSEFRWGNVRAAEQICRDVIRQMPDKPHLVGSAENSLIPILLARGAWDEAARIAQRYYEQTWSNREHDPEAAIYWSRIYANCLRHQAAFAEAREIQQRAVELVNDLLARPDFSYHFALSSGMADLLTECHDWKNAERIWRHSIQAAHKQSAPQHPELARNLVGPARFLSENGFPQDGKDLLEEILSIQNDKLGGEHLATTESTLLLGEVRVRLGAVNAGILEAQSVHEIRKKKLGPKELETVDAGIRLARLLRQSQRYEEAESLLREALHAAQSRLSAPDERWGRAYLELADALLEKNRFADASEILEHAREELQPVVPPRSWQLAEVNSRLGECYVETGRLAEGRSLLDSSLQILMEAWGTQHARARHAAARLKPLSSSPEPPPPPTR